MNLSFPKLYLVFTEFFFLYSSHWNLPGGTYRFAVSLAFTEFFYRVFFTLSIEAHLVVLTNMECLFFLPSFYRVFFSLLFPLELTWWYLPSCSVSCFYRVFFYRVFFTLSIEAHICLLFLPSFCTEFCHEASVFGFRFLFFLFLCFFLAIERHVLGRSNRRRLMGRANCANHRPPSLDGPCCSL